MTFFYDLNRKLNELVTPKETLNEGACGRMEEVSYSAKAARAGKDIGKPGKQFAKIAKSAGERYGSQERGEKVAGAVLKKLRAKESVEETDMDESALQAYLGKKKYGETGMKALQKAGREGASKQTMARIRAKHDRMDEADMEEGNEFSGALAKARATGSATFKVDGKTYQVKEAELDEREFDTKEKFDRQAKPGDTYRGHKGTITKTRSGETHRRRHEEEPESDKDHDEDDKPKTKGRPKGTKRAIGAKGPTGRSKLLKKGAIKETGVEEDYDQDEYDEEGEMAKSQSRTIADAAVELQGMLDDNENLPEWVQKKINLAQEYIDSARDYLKSNRPEDEMVSEKAVSKAQRKAAGIARAAQKGDIPKSELRGASKAMAKMPAGELRKFAKTKEKGLPKKKEESVEETTTAGSVATSAEAPKKSKGGMHFGKGIYDSLNREVETIIAESMNVSMNVSSEGQNSVTVTATDEDAAKLASLLKMAGIGGEMGGDEHACPTCGGSPCGCAEQVDENQPDWPTNTETSDDALQYSGGLNKPKRDVAGDGQSTVPVTAVRTAEEDDLARLREMAGLSEAAKPDFLDLDKDGDKKEPMKKASKEKHDKEVKESILGMSRLWKEYQG